jgi:hypothetical protein
LAQISQISAVAGFLFLLDSDLIQEPLFSGALEIIATSAARLHFPEMPSHNPQHSIFCISIESAPSGEDAVTGGWPPISLVTQEFPFTFGRSGLKVPEHQVSGNGLLLAEVQPYHVSRRHCVIEYGPDGTLQLRDYGSTLGTEVDGKFLSRRRALFVAPLPEGEHFVRLGGPRSPHCFRLVVSRLRTGD